MSSFNDFLRINGIPQTIQATNETVWFENTNGKKFVYLLDDVERCLKRLWLTGDSLDKLLKHDWTYEEGKYRQALGEILKDEKCNAVVSSLGSQTPNTVRCLELYAYYRLQLRPTSELDKPEILRSDSLAPIFRTKALAEEFTEWLQKKELAPKSIESYVGALSGVLSRTAGRPLLEIASFDEFDAIRRDLLREPEIERLNTTGNSMYSAALTHYAAFLQQRRTDPSAASDRVDLSDFTSAFENALVTCGFSLSNPISE
jgi:hypothetical protein